MFYPVLLCLYYKYVVVGTCMHLHVFNLYITNLHVVHAYTLLLM